MENNERVNKRKYSAIGSGIFLLFLGVLGLLVNFHIITFTLLLNFILAYWPVFIILAGVQIIVSSRENGELWTLLVDFAFYTIVVLALVFGQSRIFPQFESKQAATVIESIVRGKYPDATSKSYAITVGAAQLNVQDVSNTRYILATGPKGFTMNANQEDTGRLAITFRNDPESKFLRFASFNRAQPYSLELGMSELPTTMDVVLGASDGTINLSRTALTNLSTTVGAGNLNVNLSDISIPREITVKVGAGKTRIVLSNESKVRVTYAVGAGMLHIVFSCKQN